MFAMTPMGGAQQRPPMPMQQAPQQPQPMQNPQMMQQLAQAQALRNPTHGISGAPLQPNAFR